MEGVFTHIFMVHVNCYDMLCPICNQQHLIFLLRHLHFWFYLFVLLCAWYRRHRLPFIKPIKNIKFAQLLQEPFFCLALHLPQSLTDEILDKYEDKNMSVHCVWAHAFNGVCSVLVKGANLNVMCGFLWKDV